MITISPTFLIRGDSFSPAKVRLPPEYKFDRANEPGEIGTRGRFKNAPTPFGAAQIRFGGKEEGWFVRNLSAFESVLSSLRAAGAVDISLLVTIEYEGQCNWEMSPDELALLAKLKVPLLLTCYERQPRIAEGQAL